MPPDVRLALVYLVCSFRSCGNSSFRAGGPALRGIIRAGPGSAQLGRDGQNQLATAAPGAQTREGGRRLGPRCGSTAALQRPAHLGTRALRQARRGNAGAGGARQHLRHRHCAKPAHPDSTAYRPAGSNLANASADQLSRTLFTPAPSRGRSCRGRPRARPQRAAKPHWWCGAGASEDASRGMPGSCVRSR